MKIQGLPGINIQWPISELIISGKKTVETRTYPIPLKYLNRDLLMIETPGPKGNFKARIVAVIRFSKSKPYKNKKDFYSDHKRHLVDQKSDWAWQKDKPKWGWEIAKIENLVEPLPAQFKRGIIFTSRCNF